MSKQCCFLCASDEGIFLDITANNKQIFHAQFEICSLDKEVSIVDKFPTKICHKCAYELNQCSSFLQKCKSLAKRKSVARRHCCCLCYEPAKNEFIFDLNEDKSFEHNLFNNIQQLFNHEQLEKFHEGHKLICLSCRYTLDVLFDLKNIYKETATTLNDITNKEVDRSTFPKIKTTVVSRKTTITKSDQTNLYALQELESNLYEMGRTQNNKKSKEKTELRNCTKCHNVLKSNDYMHKIHKTRNIVCKSCSNDMNIRQSKTRKQIEQHPVETKHCTVFLKDVLKDNEIKEKRLYRVEEDDKGNKTYTVTDKDLTSRKKPVKGDNNMHNDIARTGQKRSTTSIKNENENTNNDRPNKKHKSEVKEKSNTDLDESKPVTRQLIRQLRQRNVSNNNSNNFVSKTKKSKTTLTKHKLATGTSLSDADIDNKQNRKKLSTILKGIPLMKNIGASDDESSSNEDILRRKRTRFTSISPITISSSDSDVIQKNSEKNIPSREKKNVIPEVTKSLTLLTEEVQSSESNNEGIFETQTYVCDECGASYENKLMGLTHKLMHYKQPKLKLQKLSNESLAEKTLDSIEITDNQSEDLSEAIALMVEDDEEELVEDENNLNTSNHVNLSKKEILEDAVDVKLVMKESDDDQIHKIEKKEEEMQEVTPIRITVNLSIQDKVEDEECKEMQSKNESNYNKNGETDKTSCGSTENENVNSEGKQDISHSDTENTQGVHEEESEQKEDEQVNNISRMENKNDNDITHVKAREDNDIECAKGKGDDYIEQVRKEEDDNIEQVKEKGNDDIEEVKDNDIEQVKVKEKVKDSGIEQIKAKKRSSSIEQIKEKEENSDIEQAKEKEENSDIEQAKEKEEENSNIERTKEKEEENSDIEQAKEKEEKNDDIEQTKEKEEKNDDIEQAEKEKDTNTEQTKEKRKTNIKISEEEKEEEMLLKAQDNEINKEDLNKSSKNLDKCISEGEVDSFNKEKQNDTENEQKENKIEKQLEQIDDLKETSEQTTVTCMKKIKSSVITGIETKSDDSEKISKAIVLQEGSMDKEDVNGEVIIQVNTHDVEISECEGSKEKGLTSDSANVAAAEMLQEVLDLANAEVKKRQETSDTNTENNSIEAETLENISREIHSSIDMPPLKIDDVKSGN